MARKSSWVTQWNKEHRKQARQRRIAKDKRKVDKVVRVLWDKVMEFFFKKK